MTKLETNKYKLLTFLRYLGDAFFYPFFSLYLKETNMVESRIGFILSISPIIAIIANPIYSYLCKDIIKTKKILNIITILEGIIIFIISFSTNFILISSLVFLMAIFGSCHYGLLDSLTTVYTTENKMSYSSVRVFGSISYILGTTIGGYIIKFLNFRWAFGFACLLFILCGLIYALIKPIDLDTDNSKDINNSIASDISDKNSKENRLIIFKNIKFLGFAIFYAFLMSVTTSTDHFFSLYLESRDVNSDEYGLVYSYFVLFEVITIFILTKSKLKLSTESMLIISSFSLAIRLLCNCLYLPVIVIIIVSSLRGIGYAILLHVSFQYVVNIVGKKKGTFAIMMMTLFSQLLIALFENVNGFIIEKHSYKLFYFVNFILAIAIVIFSIIRYFINRKNYNKLNTGDEL